MQVLSVEYRAGRGFEVNGAVSDNRGDKCKKLVESERWAQRRKSAKLGAMGNGL